MALEQISSLRSSRWKNSRALMHQSAFLSEADEQHFNADTSGKKFLDTKSASCAEFIAKVAKEKFGFEDPSLAELIEWAHIIDGAFYESPAQCCGHRL